MSWYLQALNKLGVQIDVFSAAVETVQRDEALIVVELAAGHVIQALAVEGLSTCVHDRG